MYTVSDLKRGLVLEYEGAPFVVESLQTSSPSARGGNTITKVKMRNLLTKQRAEKSFRGSETFGVPDVDKRPVQFLYSDPSGFHFMDSETFEQFAFSADDLEWEAKFLTEGVEGVRAFYFNQAAVGLELPTTVSLDITEAAPAVKGNSATGRTKAATLETGHIVQIPEHIDQGTRVTVDTRTGEFLGRAKD
ncbi:MAG: elongation factor P [Planctomycetes bacterium]|nr:elongation factor P [Planctomycetota bacterium]